MKILAIVIVLLAMHTADAERVGACEISFRFAGEPAYSSTKGNQLLTPGILNGRGAYYHDGTRTWDTWRYARTHNLPLTTWFTDSMNVEWQVKLVNQRGVCTMCVPGNSEMRFWGDEPDRVGMDATAQFMCFTFSYEPSGWWHSHGIRLRTEGFTDPQYANNNWDNWQKALELVKTGADIGSSLATTGIAIAGAAGK